jgi:nucleoside-diphosphate-sugar epimerase
MSRLLVTGAAGFIGSHLCERLLDEGAEVVGVDCFTDFYDPLLKRRNSARLIGRKGFRLLELDLRTAPLEAVLEGIDAVFHQAAQAGVRSSWGRRFSEYSSINIDGTQRLLSACRGIEGRLTRFVYASSSSIYGDAPRYPTVEDDPKLPVSPYGVTKLAGELLVRLHAVNYGLPATSLRYFTVYGPRQRPDMGFHRFWAAIERGEPVVVYGDGEQTRDFTYISDAVEANVLAWRTPCEPGMAFNIGGGARVSIRGVLGMMERLGGRPVRITHAPAPPGDVRHTGADTTKARERLGHAPRVTLDEGLDRMRTWMVRYLAGEEE